MPNLGGNLLSYELRWESICGEKSCKPRKSFILGHREKKGSKEMNKEVGRNLRGP